MRIRRRTSDETAPANDGSINATISGNVSNSQVALGNANVQTQTVTTTTVTLAELDELRDMFASLKEQVVVADVPADQRVAALAQVAELEQAALADEPDVSKIRNVGHWFQANLPTLAGAVTSIVIHPIVGKIVGAAGDALVAEFSRS